ncbi:hypothetical protein [Flammeovirga aprica]|uniref:Uncharacterized protein n=1 Tax=Flammeovirga aprica JL-4 TaxID=694437 RepID=A0A7X9XCE3_9BACT|nr:hypothetical protein [Flammeovirga aprica]NME71726.1 hypothetical protein [Flammeovirga aprica JL-4]
MLKFFFITVGIAQEAPIEVLKKTIDPQNRQEHYISPFFATKGDKIKINVKVEDHKKDMNLSIKRYPGGKLVYKVEDKQIIEHSLDIPNSGLYEISYTKAKKPFTIEVDRIPASETTRELSKARYEYVRIPDTVHRIESYEKYIGADRTIIPRTERVVTRKMTSSEVICQNSFALEAEKSQLMVFMIPQDREDDYLTKKLVSWSITLFVDDAVYRKLKQKIGETLEFAVTAGMEKGLGRISKGRMDKKNDVSNYNYGDIKQSRGEKGKDFADGLSEIIGNELDSKQKEIFDELRDPKGMIVNAGVDVALSKVGRSESSEVVKGFIADPQGQIFDIGVEKGLSAVGVPENIVQGIKDIELPSISDATQVAADAITPHVKEKIHFKITDLNNETVIDDQVSGQYAKTYGTENRDNVFALQIDCMRENLDYENFLVDYVYGSFIIEATYETTNYKDAFFYDVKEDPIYTKEKRSTQSVYYRYEIMDSRDIQPHYKIISPQTFHDPNRIRKFGDAKPKKYGK